MKLLPFILLLMVTFVHAQTTEETLANQIERLRKVMEKPDSTILADLADDDLVYVHSSGTVRDKQGFIDEFMKGWTIFTKVELRDQVITLSGNEAIVRHRLVADAAIPGYPDVIDIIILMVWRNENGTWKMLARQAAKIPTN